MKHQLSLISLAFFVVTSSCVTKTSLRTDNHRVERSTASDVGVYSYKTSPALNAYIKKALDVPYFFLIPRTAYTDLEVPKELIDSGTLIYDYAFMRQDPAQSKTPAEVKDLENQIRNLPGDLGVRMYLADGSRSRKDLAMDLAKIMKPGDIVLSYRQEWAGTGPYPQIQLGISHSTLAYRDDAGRMRNLDMPLNEEMMEDTVEKGPSYFSSTEHFRKLDAMHILRPRITDKERETINTWAKIFAEGARTGYAKNRGAFYPGKIGFNTDYLSPLIRGDQPSQYGFYAHNLARIALGYSNISPKKFQMFCSEFIWSILSLRDCDPVLNKKDFAANTTAACVKPFYNPINLLGDYPTNTSSHSSDIGGADGPLMILQDIQSPNIQADINQIFAPSSKGEDMSAGHKAVTASIPSALFTGIAAYYSKVFTAPQEAEVIRGQILAQAGAGGFGPNYSPTGWLLHAMLPEDNENRVVDYLFTLTFAKPELYRLAKSTLQQNLSLETKRFSAIQRGGAVPAAKPQRDDSIQSDPLLAKFDALPAAYRKAGYCAGLRGTFDKNCKVIKEMQARKMAIPYMKYLQYMQ